MSPPEFPFNGLVTQHTVLRIATRSNAAALLNYYAINRNHLRRWEPLRSNEFYTHDSIDKRLSQMEQQMAIGNALHLLLYPSHAGFPVSPPAANEMSAVSGLDDPDDSGAMGIFTPHTSKLIGECNFTNIIRGPFQACHLGFSISAQFEGKGLMCEALAAAIDYIFCEYKLHRIMANYCPENRRSGRLLTRLGFEREGLARAYLKINGFWADHVLTSLINPVQ